MIAADHPARTPALDGTVSGPERIPCAGEGRAMGRTATGPRAVTSSHQVFWAPFQTLNASVRNDDAAAAAPKLPE